VTARRGARREPEATRERLLAAAAEVFLELGYDGARVVDIAKRAGVTTGAIYAHFRDKADLLVKTLATHGADAVASELVRESRMPVASLLSVLADLMLSGELRSSELMLLDASAAAGREPELRARLGEAIDEHASLLEAMIERAYAEGALSREIPEAAVLRFLLILRFGSIVTRTLGLPPPEATEWQELIRRLLEGVAPGRAAGRGAARRRSPRADR
jgi:AcrR family transcriptional regulator